VEDPPSALVFVGEDGESPRVRWRLPFLEG
jgi:hypothetical protein